MKQSSSFDLKRVLSNLQAGTGSLKQRLPSGADMKRMAQKLPIDQRLLTRRNVIVVGAGAVALAAVSAWALNWTGGGAKSTRKGRPTEVSIAELMKPGPLPELQIGKDDAPITVVEYASMTCGHCAHFHNTVYPALKQKYIDTGKVRLLVREFPLDERATGAAMLARCTSADKTVPLISALFARQEEWAFVAKESFMPEFSKFARQVGFTEETMRTCLKDEVLMDNILAVRKRAVEEFGVGSTPTFFINGKRLGSGNAIEDFDKAFEPLLKN